MGRAYHRLASCGFVAGGEETGKEGAGRQHRRLLVAGGMVR